MRTEPMIDFQSRVTTENVTRKHKVSEYTRTTKTCLLSRHLSVIQNCSRMIINVIK